VNTSVTLEIVGYSYSECSPFPCDENKTCGLVSCAPSASLLKAYEALKIEVEKEFGECVNMKLTLLDDGVPDAIRDIYEREHPAIPMILIQGKVIPVGRISWPLIRDALMAESGIHTGC
jgi:hypothetical protein